VLAVILCLIGIAVGKGLIASWVFWDQIPKDVAMQNHPLLMRAIVFLLAPFVGFQIYDLIWFGIAAMQAWRMARPIQLNIQGPFGAGQQPMSPPMSAPEMFSASPQVHNAPPTNQPARSAPRSTPLPQAVAITLVSAAISVFVYAREEGWVFAAGSVLCIMVHELGHTIACLLYGLPASSPIFIPYVGAVINLRAQPPNAKVESVIGIAGPIGGLLAAAACYAWYVATHAPLAAELVQFGAVINLFNLVPIHPLDGGRIARGIAPGFWAVFLLPIAAFCALAPKLGIRTEVAVLSSVITGVGVARTLHGRKGDYYNIPPTAAWFMGFLYLAVAAALLWMWAQVQGVVSIF
jgi:Zn-dependent protease